MLTLYYAFYVICGTERVLRFVYEVLCTSVFLSHYVDGAQELREHAQELRSMMHSCIFDLILNVRLPIRARVPNPLEEVKKEKSP
jgi:hypothetical protein